MARVVYVHRAAGLRRQRAGRRVTAGWHQAFIATSNLLD
jgi:hypothetical protein